ncbi:hypothetical protein KKC83_02775 [Patescibacteria group bacterium]|nr:hypothetical protein [Candidatus Falkowbacteria bacterium]MBU3906270.1 hypothetical protein [Patescibacteria group bacterium]MBU4015023.1 hypothetical protein [Patescibacteria group bacterium]MBU4026441.1 hypothetical protein [Patescibacteria group bacterium]MBU4072584.1 hypothetical protein [Patescibacteria group bacterium]
MLKLLKLNKHFITGIFIVAMCAVFLLPNSVLAQNNIDIGMEYGNQLGLSSEDPRIIIVKIIRILLGFLGLIAVSFIMYAGWLWMTSEGDEQKIRKAKDTLKSAIIGLVIMLASFAIVSFILQQMQGALGGIGPGGAPPDLRVGINALGGGIIEAHYPSRNQTDVPRNTKIAITFKEPMRLADIISDTNGSGSWGDWIDDGDSIMEDGEYDKINSSNILIYKTVVGSGGPFTDDLYAASTADKKSFVFRQVDPSNYIGSPSENIWYSIALTKDIKKDNGDSAFQGVVGDIAYEWSFQVSTIIDITPPQIIDVIPEPNNTYARNIVVQINFNEAVDPLLSSGETINGFTNIEVQDLGSGLNTEGAFYVSNQYKTVEFLTTDACGVNSCGGTIYCLPGNANVQSLIKAADLASFLGGIADMADNSLDGNADGTAQGPVSDCDLAGLPDRPTCLADGDNAFWQFSTNNTIDLTPPEIEAILPASGQSAVSLSAVPEAIFSKYLLSATLNTTNIIMSSDPVHLFNHWIGKNNDTVLGRTSAYIYHDQFEEDTDYAPLFFSEILDVYQNCYNPAAGPGCAPNPPSQPYCCPNPSLPGSFILSASSCP